jgi:ornithine--oxo-acid transaminase
MKAKDYIQLEDHFGANNYAPIPVVISHGKGAKVWDVDGQEYLDFLSAYSAVNQGHCHPRLVEAAKQQLEQLTLTSRAFYNNRLGVFESYLCGLLGFDRMIPMNSGVEACETAVKLARRWGYDVKKIPSNTARVVFAEGNFWGRSIAAVSSSTDPVSRNGFGPFVPNFDCVPYNDLVALERAISGPNVCAFMVEPIQGEAGVIVPSEGYLRGVRELCTRYKVLMIADEVQTGLGRTGKMLACDHEGVKPDILILGKALSGGILPVSAALSSNEVMELLQPGEHGSTFGGNPLASAVALEAVRVVVDEDLPARSEHLGKVFRQALAELGSPLVSGIRGKGLLNAFDLKTYAGGKTAKNLCYALMKRGLLCKQTHTHTIRFAPPLVISEQDLHSGLEKIGAALQEAEREHDAH